MCSVYVLVWVFLSQVIKQVIHQTQSPHLSSWEVRLGLDQDENPPQSMLANVDMIVPDIWK